MSETGNTTNASVGMQQPNATVTKRKGVAEITVRTLQDTLKDAEFAARLLLEGFRPKMVHAVGEKNISICLKNAVCNHRGLDPAFYSRNFVAECEGRRAGIVQIAFNGDKYFQKKDHLSEMSYYAQFRWFFLSFVQTKVPPGMCYVDHIVVEEEFRGKGVGKVLLETAENAAREKNCNTIYLEVVASNPRAKRLYERVGYETKSEVNLYGLLWYLIGEKSMFRMEKSLRKP